MTNIDDLKNAYEGCATRGDSSGMITFAKRILAEVEGLYGKESPSLIDPLHKLAVAYLANKESTEAVFAMRQAINLCKKDVNNNPALAGYLCTLGGLLSAQKNYQESESFLNQALEMTEESVHEKQMLLVAILVNLTGLLTGQGRYIEAETIGKRALKIAESEQGPHPGDVGAPLLALAMIYKAQKRFSEAEPLYERALKLTEEDSGPLTPIGLADLLDDMADLFEKTNRQARATEFKAKSAELKKTLK